MKTVDEFIDELRQMPPSALVRVQIRKSEDGDTLYEFRDVEIESVIYELGEVSIRLDE